MDDSLIAKGCIAKIASRLLLLAIFCFWSILGKGQQVDAIKDLSHPNYGEVFIIGLPDTTNWSERIGIFKTGATLQVMGKWQWKADTLVFAPRFLPDPKVTYEVRYGEESYSINFASFLTDDLHVRLLPNVHKIPANSLRVYLQFSRPMGLQNPLEYVRLVDASGLEIKDAFVEVSEGLWNEDRTKLTLLFHPGRIKQSVGPNQVMGPVVAAGKNYSVRISDEFLANDGRSLGREWVFSFEVTDPVRTPIDTKSWEVEADVSVISIDAHRIIDVALIERMLVLLRGNEVIKGAWTSSGEQIQFEPNEKLAKGKYTLRVYPQLEDISGNNTFAAFDQPEKIKLEGYVQLLPISIK